MDVPLFVAMGCSIAVVKDHRSKKGFVDAVILKTKIFTKTPPMKSKTQVKMSNGSRRAA